MKKHFVIITPILFLIFLFNFIKNSPQIHQFIIVCTTNIITDIVKNIAASHAQVIGLMGPGVDPHLYRAREGDVHKLSSADLIFYNGLHLEGKMVHMLKHMQTYIKTIAVTDSIDQRFLLASEIEGIYDPHVWHDVILWRPTVKLIRDTLIEHDPAHAEEYRKNAKKYLHKLKQLDAYVRQQVKKLKPKHRILVTAHDAFSYFGKAYGFQVVGLQGISTESEISTRDVQQLVAFIVQRKIPAIFIESSISQRSIQSVKEAVKAQGWEVTIGKELFSDSLNVPGSHADTYIGMIKHNIDAIVTSISR